MESAHGCANGGMAFILIAKPMNASNADLNALVLGHECRTLAFWAGALQTPLEDRIGVAPQAMIDFIALDNIRTQRLETPHAARLDRGLLEDTRMALAELPPQVTQLLTRSFAGIYFVADFGGSGATEQILDAESRPVAAFIVLDPAVLENATANAWMTWRENTPFKRLPGHELRFELERSADDDRKQAIQYVLLHELGHVIAATHPVHPSWTIAPREVPEPLDMPFFSSSWSIARDESRYVSHFDARFPRRRNVVYYRESCLSAGELVSIYDWLAQTNFVTLYAATSPFEDFAETFAMVVHQRLMNRPFEARIYLAHQLARTFRPALEHPRWREKLRAVEQILGAA